LYYFNNTELSQVTPSRYFGAIPLYQEQEASLTGFSAIQKHFLSHPTQHVTFSIAQIDTRKLNNPSAIRIPSNFFDKLKKLEDDQIDNERKLIKSELVKETSINPFCISVQKPLNSVRVSKFGSYRRLPNGIQYFHTGMDMRAAKGTFIRAMADGEVVLAQKFVIPGNAVYVDHGNGVFSKYFHLSEILVHPHQKIKIGDLIGKSGGTGRVEAPHFHWEVSWKGYPTDPLIFLDTLNAVCSPQTQVTSL
jgi:murein DD-endopeptidase MepM/ murein hydrolase activator NlpD